MADADIPDLLTLGKSQTQTLRGEVSNLNFSVRHLFMKWWPFLNFSIITDTRSNIPFLLTLRKPVTQTLVGRGDW